jgi:hypothetical protein
MMSSAPFFSVFIKNNSLNPVLSDCCVFNLILQTKFHDFCVQADAEKPEQSRLKKIMSRYERNEL